MADFLTKHCPDVKCSKEYRRRINILSKLKGDYSNFNPDSYPEVQYDDLTKVIMMDLCIELNNNANVWLVTIYLNAVLRAIVYEHWFPEDFDNTKLITQIVQMNYMEHNGLSDLPNQCKPNTSPLYAQMFDLDARLCTRILKCST